MEADETHPRLARKWGRPLRLIGCLLWMAMASCSRDDSAGESAHDYTALLGLDVFTSEMKVVHEWAENVWRLKTSLHSSVLYRGGGGVTVTALKAGDFNADGAEDVAIIFAVQCGAPVWYKAIVSDVLGDMAVYSTKIGIRQDTPSFETGFDDWGLPQVKDR